MTNSPAGAVCRTPEELKAAIDQAWFTCASHPDLTERRAAFDRMRALIAQRSPERVAEMERERGLGR